MPKEIKDEGEIKAGEYKELVDFLSVKFDEINYKLNQKPDHNEVDVMIKAALKIEINKVTERITRLSDKIDDNHAEQMGVQKQLNKHEKWHFKTAAKVGLDLLAE